MPYDTITYEREGPLAIVTLQRPERLNALNVQMVEELRRVIREAGRDEKVRVFLLTGGADGRKRPCFCAGADMKEAPFPEDFLEGVNDLYNTIEDMGKATIAAIDGVCTAGGLELALCFDIRLAAETVRIGDLHLRNLGVGLGGAGVSSRLPRIVGLAKAKELIFTGDLIDGLEACRIGLANRVCPSEELMPEARLLGARIAAVRARGLAVVKAHLNLGAQMDLREALRFASLIGPLADAEGMADVERRQQEFASQSKRPLQKDREPAEGAPRRGTGRGVPVKEGIFTLPGAPGESPRLVGTRCAECGEVYFPPRRGIHCARCYGKELEELLLDGRGTVRSHTTVYQAPREWRGPVPYVMALIELPEKAVFYAALTGCDPPAVRTGMEVELVIEKIGENAAGDDLLGYKFRPLDGPGTPATPPAR